MKKIEFGLLLPNGAYPAERRGTFVADISEQLAIVEGHFDSVWAADHLQNDDEDILEGWSLITYFAGRNPAFHYGHTVICQSFRNPALLAKMAATLQYLSGGRFILGLGTGWLESEYQAYNYPFPSPGVRLEELEETLQIIKALWQEKQATVEGKHYAIHAAYCEPKPDPLPPIMIGGAKPRILRLIARHADWWDVSGFGVGLDRYGPCVEEMARACAEVGRDPSTLRHTYSTGCVCAPTEDEAIELAKDLFRPGRGFIGTPAQVLEKIQPFIDLGVDHFQLMPAGSHDLQTLELLVKEVLPALQARG